MPLKCRGKLFTKGEGMAIIVSDDALFNLKNALEKNTSDKSCVRIFIRSYG